MKSRIACVSFGMGSEFPLKNVVFIFVVLLLVSSVVWVVSGISYYAMMPDNVALLVVAYTLGLRHALDADHIAAIDNVTRRLVLSGKRPVTVGLYFALGHSTVVLFATMLIATLSEQYDTQSELRGIIGTIISAGFLLIVGGINFLSVITIIRCMKECSARDHTAAMDWDQLHASGGFFSRVLGARLFRAIDRPWKMYVVGLLFGLGFDTATEVSLLAIAAHQSAGGAPAGLVLCLPALFTCVRVCVCVCVCVSPAAWPRSTPSTASSCSPRGIWS